MRKLLFLTLVIVLGTSTISAEEINSSFRDAFSKYENSSSIGRRNTEFLQKFLGDTILLNFPNQYMDCFFAEQPDTVWVKKRPKKNPQEGKHYILNYAYKGIQNGENFVTPSSCINNRPFVVYNIKPYVSGEGCQVILLDVDNLDLITMNIPGSFQFDGSFTTVKTKRLIDALIDKDVYYSSDVPSYYSSYSKPKFSLCKVIGGEFQVNIEKSSGMYRDYKLQTKCEIRLRDENGTLISMNPIKASEYAYSKPIIITQEEFDKQFRGHQVNSEVDMAIIGKEENFPFSFISILGKTNTSFTGVYQSIEPNESYKTPDAYLDQEIICIGDILQVGKTKYYKACFNGKAFFIKAKDVNFTDKNEARLDTLARQPQEIRDRFFLHQLALTKAVYLESIQEAINNIQSYSKYGLAIPRWSVYDVSEYTDGTGIRFSFYNPTKSIIKYITITFLGYNAVDDPVGRSITKKCIGPIEPEETASYEFEYAWFTDVVEYAKIRSIVVQYKNGTSKTISNPTAIMFTDELRNVFYGSNPVENLK